MREVFAFNGKTFRDQQALLWGNIAFRLYRCPNLHSGWRFKETSHDPPRRSSKIHTAT
jgi:hypothetical protein